MRKEVSIMGRKIGEKHPVFVIAEAACNHECDIDLAYRMVEEAKKAGADAIKFQTYRAECLVGGSAMSYWGDGTMRQIDYYRQLDKFGAHQYEDLFDYARQKDIIPFSSPFDMDSADMLYRSGAPAFKIASCEIVNLELIRFIVTKGLPVIMSTGAATIQEIDMAVRELVSKVPFILLACVLSNPTRWQDASLGRIHALRKAFPFTPIGYSDHTVSSLTIPSMAVAAGAVVIEKHFTLDKSMKISNHFFALDPGELKELVTSVKRSKVILGSGELDTIPAEEEAKFGARKSIVAACYINEGEQIRRTMLTLLRPGDGMSPSRLPWVLQRRAARRIEAGEVIREEDVK